MNSETKNCQNCKKSFVIDADDGAFYDRINVPLPTFCWLCRAQRRMAWRNESSLFKRKSDFSGKDIFSAFAPKTPVKVYEKDVWLSDKWEALDYGIDFDFTKTFFDQFRDLLHTVPLKNLNIVNGVNSDYGNNITDPKNSYLVFNGKGAENCMYSNGLTFLKDCMDVSHLGKSEQCYQCFWLTSCSNSIFSTQCESSYNLSFCRDCVACHDCFGCVGLRNKEFHIFNEPYSKEDYKNRISEFDTSSYEELQKVIKKAEDFWSRFPRKFIEGYQNTSVSGNYISHSKNVKNSFLVREGENLRYCQYVQELPGSKDCYDYTAWGDSNQLVYECTACGIGTNSIKFCYNVQENVRDIEYSYMCSGSSDLFGCIGLKKKQYCILNKQYDKAAYQEMVNKIKKHMSDMPYLDKKGRVYKYGEFFPIEFSPFAYNETLAQEFFPKTREEADADGFVWRDSVDRNYSPTVKAENLPDRIVEVTDSITSDIIECLHRGICNDQCTKAFRITPDELQFYRKMKLPLPRLCPKCRHYQRLKQRTNLEVVHKKCQCSGERSESGVYKNNTAHFHGENRCPNEFETNYQSSMDLLYCEQCYQAEVV